MQEKVAWVALRAAVSVVMLLCGILAAMLGSYIKQTMSHAESTPEVGSYDSPPAWNWPEITAPPEVSTSWSPSVSTTVTTVPSEPAQLIVPSAGIGSVVYAHPSSVDEAISPRDAWSTAWWPGGGTPGATQENTPPTDGRLSYTTYLYGHSGDMPAVFNRVKDLEPGDDIFLETDSGTFHYAVQELFVIDKPDLSEDPRLTEDVEGRLVLISCWYGEDHVEGTATTENVVAIAQLVTDE